MVTKSLRIASKAYLVPREGLLVPAWHAAQPFANALHLLVPAWHAAQPLAISLLSLAQFEPGLPFFLVHLGIG